MNPQSALQQQFPLSPKKFWKKMFSQIVGMTVLGIIFGALISGVYLAATSNNFDLGIFVGVAIVIFLLWLCVTLIPYSLYVNAYIRRYYYAGEENFVTIKKGVFAPAEIHVQYQKIQDVYVDQDIIDRIMGLYDVHIASATVGSAIEAHIDGVEKAAAEGLKEFFLNKIQGKSWNSSSQPASANQSVAVNQSGSVSSGHITASFSEDISSATYPIGSRWIVAQALKYIFTSFIYTVVILIWIGAPGKNSDVSLLSAIGYGSAGQVFLIGVIIFAFIYGAHYIYIFLWKRNYDFKFMPEYIFLRTGIIAKSEKHVPYNTLQDVTVSQGVIERMFGLSSVRIENAASGQMVVGRNGRPIFNGIMIPGQTSANAQKITEALKNVILSKPSRSGSGLN